MFKLSSWFKVPVKKAKRKPMYPFGEMKVGQSFFCRNIKAVRASMYRFQKTSRKRFVTKPSRRGRGYRVWRAK